MLKHLRDACFLSLRLSESTAALDRSDESLHHLGVNIVAAECVQLVKPEIVASRVAVRGIIRISS